MKDKSKVLKTYGYMWDKLQFICLIGGTRRPQVSLRSWRIIVWQLGKFISFFIHIISNKKGS